LDTAQILQKELLWKYKILNMGNNILGTIHRKHRIAAKLYTLETWVVSGM
jgi:hypothetical protein